MIIKVENSYYDPKFGPVMVILTPQDKKNIASMPPEAMNYASFPDTMTEEEAREWMRDKSDKT